MKNMISEAQEPTKYDLGIPVVLRMMLGGHQALPKKASNTKARGPAFSTYMVYFVRKLEWCHFHHVFVLASQKIFFGTHIKNGK